MDMKNVTYKIIMGLAKMPRCRPHQNILFNKSTKNVFHPPRITTRLSLIFLIVVWFM